MKTADISRQITNKNRANKKDELVEKIEQAIDTAARGGEFFTTVEITPLEIDLLDDQLETLILFLGEYGYHAEITPPVYTIAGKGSVICSNTKLLISWEAL